MATGKVTALRIQERDETRVNVFLDGSFAIGVSLNTLAAERLFVGMELDADTYTRLERAEGISRAYFAALRLIEARPRSESEVRERLKRHEHTPETIDAAVAKLADLGLLDDQQFARYWVENRQNYRPRGRNALRSELRRKGVDAETVAVTLQDAELVGDETESATRLARAHVHKYAGAADRREFARRLGGFLERRGFAFSTTRGVIDALWRELQQGDDETDS